MSERVEQLLEALHASAALPFEKARAMPPGVYTNEAFLDLEQSRIFASEWICVGRQDAVDKPGDYLTHEIAGEPVVVVRNEHSELRAYSNVCRHRMSLLMTGKGNCRRMICPYHGWTYDLQGGLTGAPRMGAVSGIR